MRIIGFIPLATALLTGSLFAQVVQPSADEVNQGMAAYKSGKYDEAEAHFERAVAADPANLQARLHLANAYYIRWVPGLDQEENRSKHDQASKEFQNVLERDPQNREALAMLASMAYNSAMAAGSPEQRIAALDEATRWNQRRISANPSETEAYYYLGVLAWARVYRPIQAARVRLQMSPDVAGPISDETVRSTLQTECWRLIEDGLENLKRALELDSKNDDAMVYLNLLLRKKADLEDSAAAADADMSAAEQWQNRALETKRTKATPSDGNLVAPGSDKSVQPPPPPPPPPPPQGDGSASRLLRIGGKVAEANLIRKVDPVYPPRAKAARVQGVVEFTVIIGADGSIETTQLVRGHPLLVDAARDAVMQWKYRPTLLNGQPVRIMTDIVVRFTLVD